jgi:hypothetical protein
MPANPQCPSKEQAYPEVFQASAGISGCLVTQAMVPQLSNPLILCKHVA